MKCCICCQIHPNTVIILYYVSIPISELPRNKWNLTYCPIPNVWKVQPSVLLYSRRLNVEELRSSAGWLSSSEVVAKFREWVTGVHYRYDQCCWQAPRISAAPAPLCPSRCVPLGSEPQTHPGRTTLQTAEQHKLLLNVQIRNVSPNTILSLVTVRLKNIEVRKP